MIIHTRLAMRCVFVLLLLAAAAFAQGSPPVADPTNNAIPLVNVGGSGYISSAFAALDFGQMMLEQESNPQKEKQRQKMRQELLDSGLVSALDLAAPDRAVHEFNAGTKLLKDHKNHEAIAHFEKAIKVYPKFVAAHENLGLAYADIDNKEKARTELEAAVKLDPKFEGSLLHLGRLELAQQRFAAAEDDFARAVSIRPNDAQTLLLLCYAQHQSHHFTAAIETAGQLHRLKHANMGDVHFVAASSAISLRDYLTLKHELELFLQEQPASPLAPTARQQLDLVTKVANAPPTNASPAPGVQTFPNSERLHRELALLDAARPEETCDDCDPAPGGAAASSAPAAEAPSDTDLHGFIVRRSVDEVALFFSVSDHGRNIADLQGSELTVLDNNAPPERILQFTPQSKLPLHLALLIDTSGSVKEQFSFEKKTAARFVRKMLIGPSDMAFAGGFSNQPEITQDFTADFAKLDAGIETLQNSGGTSLFDAVDFACWKLAAYPQRERVANVLVVLTDGQDNSSRTSLRQVIRDAEKTGVTVYTIATQFHQGPKTDADKVMIEMAERSGGEAIFPTDLERSFDKLQQIVRSRYLLAYKPAGFAANGSYHTVRVSAQRDRHALQVRTRKGYYAAAGR